MLSPRRNRFGIPGAISLIALVFSMSLLALSAAPAFGAVTHTLKGSFGTFSLPSGIAVDGSNGNVFVADAGFNSVKIFGPTGGAPSGVAVTEIAAVGSSERLPIAIDNGATSPSKGALYVAEPENNTVKKFTLNPVSEKYEQTGTLSASPSFENPLAIAVNAKGNVFVGESGTFGGERAIVEFSPGGTQLDRVNVASTLFQASALAFDSAGNLYALGSGVWKFTANGSGEVDLHSTPTKIISEFNTGIAIDQSTNTLYAADGSSGRHIVQYSTSCIPVEQQCTPELEFGEGNLKSTDKVAVSPINGDIYVGDRGKNEVVDGDVAIFDAALTTVPDTATKAATVVKQTSVTLNGTVSAAGGPSATCEFQYTTRASFNSEGFEGASTAPCAPAGPFTGSTSNTVKAELSGLSTATQYVFRLRASSANGPNLGETLFFNTVGLPKINASSIGLVTADSAIIEGLVNPNGGPKAAVETTYAVEYVSKADFNLNGYDNATRVPPVGVGIGTGTEDQQHKGSGIQDVEVSQLLSGLTPLTAYHFRIVASNEAGEEKGPDKIFTLTTDLGGAVGLPDGRVYEQVTPVDKNGSAPGGASNQVQAASDGNGIAYVTGGAIPGSEGGQEFPSYLSSRGSDWSTQGLLPPATEGAAAEVLGWSEDMSRSYVDQADFLGQPRSFLQRDSATHSSRLIASDIGDIDFLGTSTDDSTVLFEDIKALLPSATTEGRNLYAWDSDSGQLSLAGVFNNGTAPAKGTYTGASDSAYTQALHVVSSDGSVFFTDVETGQLYLRENPTKPQSALDGGGKCTEPAMACTIKVSASQRATPDPFGEQPATFMGATPDGSKVFFTSSGNLTDDSTTGPFDLGHDLYRYDVANNKLVDVSIDTNPGDFLFGADVQGVLGTSDDGSYVYFAANGVLAPGATPGGCFATVGSSSGECSLYLWHNGVTTLIAPVKLPGDHSNFAQSFLEKTARVSADGKALLFGSNQKLTDYDNEGTYEFYRYSAAEDDLLCVTCNPSGRAPIGAPALRSIDKPTKAQFSPSILTRNLSADGNRVFFETSEKLVAADTNGDASCDSLNGVGPPTFCQDVYEWEAKGSGTCHSEAQNGGCLYLLSTGTGTDPAFFADASPSGNDAFIFTVDRLVGQDGDQILDIYDARVGGGIASQNPPPPPVPCEGEGCKSGSPPPPGAESPGTATFAGPGNQKASQHKKKRRHQHKKKRHHHKRHASRKHG